MPYMLGCAEYATSMLQNCLMQWLGTPKCFPYSSRHLCAAERCVVHEHDYERLEVRRKKSARELCVGTYHLLSSLFSTKSLCLLRVCWLQPRPEHFANKTRQPKKVFRLLNIWQLLTAAAGHFAPTEDADDPEAHIFSI